MKLKDSLRGLEIYIDKNDPIKYDVQSIVDWAEKKGQTIDNLADLNGLLDKLFLPTLAEEMIRVNGIYLQMKEQDFINSEYAKGSLLEMLLNGKDGKINYEDVITDAQPLLRDSFVLNLKSVESQGYEYFDKMTRRAYVISRSPRGDDTSIYLSQLEVADASYDADNDIDFFTVKGELQIAKTLYDFFNDKFTRLPFDLTYVKNKDISLNVDYVAETQLPVCDCIHNQLPLIAPSLMTNAKKLSEDYLTDKVKEDRLKTMS